MQEEENGIYCTMYVRSPHRRTAFWIAFVLFCLLVAAFLAALVFSGAPFAAIDISRRYFFLVRTCEETTSAAVAGESYRAGGAGVIWEGNVVLACYYTEADAIRVQGAMQDRGVETEISIRRAARFRLGGSAAEMRMLVRANADTADSCARILYDTANELQKTGITQEGARAAVRGVKEALSGLIAANTDRAFERWNAFLDGFCRDAEEVCRGILFAKDVRALQVKLCAALASFGEYF